jgi:hypothetical protein
MRVGGIIALICGVFGVISNAMGIYSIASLPAPGGSQPGIEPSVAITMGVCGLVDTALSAALVMAGILLVRRRRGARWWTLANAYPALGMTVLEFLIWLKVGPQVSAAMNGMTAARTGMHVPPGVSEISNAIGFVFALALPLLMIWFVRSRPAREWFDRRGEP